MFRIGDRAKCIDDFAFNKGLVKGKIYTIKNINKDGDIYLEEMLINPWLKSRFIKEDTMFKVGDRVKRSSGIYVNDLATVIGIRDKEILIKYDKNDSDKNVNCYEENDLKLIGGTMYQNLKERIESVTAWDKEADDILREIYKNFPEKGHWYLGICGKDKCGVDIIIDGKAKEKFPYNTQCEKLEAFKKALMWLLDHSDIKKDISEGKRRYLQNQMSKIEEKLANIQKELQELK